MKKRLSGSTYLNRLCIPEGHSGSFAIKHETHEAGYKFPLASLRTSFMGGDAHGTITYDISTTWHKLIETCDGVEGLWMSDYPIEQGQHNKELRDFVRGSVLVGGLGLGYAATVLATRKQITKVVVVEKSPDVVALVAPHLCAGDPAALAKIEVVTADLFEYLPTVPERTFDRAFYDIWTMDGESTFFEVVVPLLRLSDKRVKHNPVCWNENVMRGQLWLSLDSRAHFALEYAKAFPEEASKSERERAFLTLDEMATANGSIWIDWCVPFWQWVRDTQPDAKTRERFASFYAMKYGQPRFTEWWRDITRTLYPSRLAVNTTQQEENI